MKNEVRRTWWQRLLRLPIDLGVMVWTALWQPVKRYFYLTRRDAQGFAVWCVMMALTLGFKWGYPKWEAAHANNIMVASAPPRAQPARPTAQNRVAAQPASSQTRAASAQAPSPYGTPYRKKAIVVDLNLADTLDLQEVRGIGPAYARRIVAYRDRLGGFVHKAQLMEVWGIDSAAYSRIEPGVVLSSSPLRLMNINQLSIQELKKHPYLDYYQAKEIVRYREQYGAFEAKSDLKKVNLIDGDTYCRIAPYLSVAAASDEP